MPYTKNKQNEEMSLELTEKVSHIQDKVDDLSTQVTDMHQQMREMYNAIVGNQNFGQVGLVKRVESLEKTKAKWEKKIQWTYGYIFGAGTLITAIFELIKSRL